MKGFADKYREIKVQTSRRKIVNTQYAIAQGGTGVMNTIFMRRESASRRRSQEAKDRKFSFTGRNLL